MFNPFAAGLQPSGPMDADVVSPTELAQGAAALPPLEPAMAAPADPAAADAPMRTSIDSLARKLDDQHIRLEDAPIAPARRPPSPPSLDMPDLPPQPPCPELEMDHQSPIDAGLLHAPLTPMSPPGDAPPSPADGEAALADAARRRHPGASTARTIQRVEDMISARYQCNVYAPPTPTFLESDSHALMLGRVDLEVDDAENIDTSWIDSVPSLRRASGPGGIRKHHPLLRYRTSAEVALQCPVVVKNRPRMRRRKRTPATTPSVAGQATPALPASSALPALPPPVVLPFATSAAAEYAPVPLHCLPSLPPPLPSSPPE